MGIARMEDGNDAESPDRARGSRRPRSAGGEENEDEDECDVTVSPSFREISKLQHQDSTCLRKLVVSKSFLLFCHRWPSIESEQIDEMLAETRELSGRQYQKGPVYVDYI
jgi:hypothetical protein